MPKLHLSLLIAALGLAAFSFPAAAHITLETKEAMVGAAFKAVLVVGHGCGAEATTAMRVQIPAGFYNVKPMPKAGWTVETVIGAYAKPYMNHGTEMSEGVTEISWSGGSLPDAFFDEFSFRGTFGGDLKAGSRIAFPVIQGCGATEDAWIDTSGDDDAEMPAPSVTLVPAMTPHHH
jgi:periplasmic copper chaperone A